MMTRGLAAVLVTILVGCSGGPQATRPLRTPGIGQWPPVIVSSDIPAGITLVQDGDSFVLTNGSARSVWLSPPGLEVWTGLPWTVPPEPRLGVVELPPGATRRFEPELSAADVRVSVQLWPTPTPDRGSGAPWFLWLEPTRGESAPT
jgi:hypothetical protein